MRSSFLEIEVNDGRGGASLLMSIQGDLGWRRACPSSTRSNQGESGEGGRPVHFEGTLGRRGAVARPRATMKVMPPVPIL